MKDFGMLQMKETLARSNRSSTAEPILNGRIIRLIRLTCPFPIPLLVENWHFKFIIWLFLSTLKANYLKIFMFRQSYLSRDNVLQAAVRKNRIEVISLLLDRGANPNKVLGLHLCYHCLFLPHPFLKTGLAGTAFECRCSNEVLQLLIDRGMDVSKVCSFVDATTLPILDSVLFSRSRWAHASGNGMQFMIGIWKRPISSLIMVVSTLTRILVSTAEIIGVRESKALIIALH